MNHMKDGIPGTKKNMYVLVFLDSSKAYPFCFSAPPRCFLLTEQIQSGSEKE